MRKQEQWGIDTSASLLISSIRVCLLKRKTRFLVGQTFVAYRGSILAKLLTSTAFFNSSSTLLGVSFWCSVTPIMWKQNDKVFSDTIAFFATMIWLGFSTLFHGNGTGWLTWKLDILRDL